MCKDLSAGGRNKGLARRLETPTNASRNRQPANAQARAAVGGTSERSVVAGDSRTTGPASEVSERPAAIQSQC